MNFDAMTTMLQRSLRGRVEPNFELGPLTTYRLGGPTAVYAEPEDEKDLDRLIEIVRAEGDVSILPFGRGSNLVVSDEGWPGVAIRVGRDFGHIHAGEGENLVFAGAGVSLPQLANWCGRRALTGTEFGVGIPGSVGGAVRMNAGAHKQDVAAVLDSAVVVDAGSGLVEEIPAADLGFSYRHSALDDRRIVAGATFRLRPDETPAIRARMEHFRRHRAETQPGALANAGSVFKNPPGDFAGRLVEAAGLKSFRVGGASVSDVHANFFIAGPGATSQDVHDLVQEVARRVEDSFGVRLEPEIRFVGRFSTETP
ncbi:MAG: UDP-N-acetylmuramate dehydrogenase [Actinomycetota bacterium]